MGTTGQGTRGMQQEAEGGGGQEHEKDARRGGSMMRGGRWGARRLRNNQLNKRDVMRGGDQGASKQHDNQVRDGWDERPLVPMIMDGKDNNQDATRQPQWQCDCDCACVYYMTVTAPVSTMVDGRHQASGGSRNGILLWRVIMMQKWEQMWVQQKGNCLSTSYFVTWV